MNTTKVSISKPVEPHDQALVGKQQLLIKSQLQKNALIARQQLAVKSALSAQSNKNNK